VASGDAVGQWFLPDSLFVNKPVDVLLRPQSGGLPSGPRARISVAPRDRPYRRRAAPPVIRSDRPGRWRSARGPSCGESDKQRRPGDRPESKRCPGLLQGSREFNAARAGRSQRRPVPAGTARERRRASKRRRGLLCPGPAPESPRTRVASPRGGPTDATCSGNGEGGSGRRHPETRSVVPTIARISSSGDELQVPSLGNNSIPLKKRSGFGGSCCSKSGGSGSDGPATRVLGEGLRHHRSASCLPKRRQDNASAGALFIEHRPPTSNDSCSRANRDTQVGSGRGHFLPARQRPVMVERSSSSTFCVINHSRLLRRTDTTSYTKDRRESRVRAR
jgi:hypothetical protein